MNDYEKEEREINNILLIAIPVVVIIAAAVILWLANHFEKMQ